MRYFRLKKSANVSDAKPGEVKLYADADGALHTIDQDGTVADMTGVSVVTLTDNDIQALPITPFQLVPAPGEGKAVIPLSLVLSFNYTAGYGAFSGTAFIGMAYQDDGSIAVGTAGLYESLGGVSSFLDVGESMTATLGINASPVNGFELGLGSDLLVAWATINNKALNLKASNGGVQFSGGDPANTLTATVVYSTINLA